MASRSRRRQTAGEAPTNRASTTAHETSGAAQPHRCPARQNDSSTNAAQYASSASPGAEPESTPASPRHLPPSHSVTAAGGHPRSERERHSSKPRRAVRRSDASGTGTVASVRHPAHSWRLPSCDCCFWFWSSWPRVVPQRRASGARVAATQRRPARCRRAIAAHRPVPIARSATFRVATTRKRRATRRRVAVGSWEIAPRPSVSMPPCVRSPSVTTRPSAVRTRPPARSPRETAPPSAL